MVKLSFPSLRDRCQKRTLSKDNRTSLDNRTSFFSNDWKPARTLFIKKTTIGGLLFIIWFLLTSSYIYGTLYLSPGRYQNFRVLAVDYDGGVIGQSLRGAYQQLEGPGFFNLEFHSPEEYPSEDDMYHAVWEGEFWGAISATPGASSRLEATLQGGLNASTYNPNNALHYIWNQQYYPAFASSVVNAGMQSLIGATRITYNHIFGIQATSLVNQTDPTAVQALLNPIAATERNIKKAGHGGAILLNTIGTIIPVLSQFFFLLVLNGATAASHLYTTLPIPTSYLTRRVFGLFYAFLTALCQTGYTWYYRESWDVNGAQFMLTWMTFWLLMVTHQVFLETFATLAGVQIMPFVVLAWLFMNIASTLSPLEMQAGFFHWSIVLPGHNAHSILVTIWTGGADNRLYRALPILFAWLVAGLMTTFAVHVRACRLAVEVERGDGGMGSLGKDEEEGTEREGVPMSQETTMSKSEVELMRRGVVQGEEEGKVYGPSIPQ